MILPEKTLETLRSAFAFMLSMDSDRSLQRNGVGFNKYDSEKVHEDYDKSHEITDEFINKHARKLIKYEKQLVEKAGMNLEDLQNALAAFKSNNYPKVHSDNAPQPLKDRRIIDTEKIQVSIYPAVTPENVTTLTADYKVKSSGLPKAIKGLHRFAAWKPVYDENNNIKKVPYAINGYLCKWKDPTNLMSFDKAVNLLSTSSDYGGLQFVLLKQDSIVAIDYDHVIDEFGTISNSTLKDLETLGFPYTEVSPSGTGLRVLFYGQLPKAQYHKEGLPEFYADNKLMTITGHHLDGTSTDIASVLPTTLLDILRSYYPTDYNSEKGPEDIPRTSEIFTDQGLINQILRSKIGPDFKKAYINGEDIKDNASDTDFYVLIHLGFYTQDVAQIFRVMQNSGLIRQKWSAHNSIEEPWGSYIDSLDLPRTYHLTLSIVNALKGLDTVYKQEGKITLYKKCGEFFCNSTGVFIKQYKKKPVFDENSEKSSYEIVLEDHLICATPAYISSTGYNQKTGKFYVKLTYFNYAGDEKTQWVQPEALTLKTKLLAFANELAITDDKDSSGLLAKYFQAAILEARNEPMEPVYSSIGYQDDYSCYILGDRKITAEGIETIVPLEMKLAEKLTKKGTLEGYVKAGISLMQFPVLRVKFYFMMSSLILDLIYGKNITATHIATSGNLKGDSSYWIMGAFGHPVLFQLNPSSTNLGFQGHMESMEGLPTSVEELTGNSKMLKDLQYFTTTGVTRTTKTRAQELKGGRLIKGVVCVNSETPIFSSKDRLGNVVRNLNLDDKINTCLSNKDIMELEELINNNYGWAGELLIQIILQEKENLQAIMTSYEENLPEVEGIPENRFKIMCAFISLSGFLCEKLFTQIGIPNEDPLELVKHFMEKNLETGITEPLYSKALKVVAEYFSIYKHDFAKTEEGESEPSHRRGFIERNSLAVIPGDIDKYIDQELGAGQTKSALVELEFNGLMITKRKGQLKSDHNGIPVYKLKKDALKKYAQLDLDNLDSMTEEEEEQEEDILPKLEDKLPHCEEVKSILQQDLDIKNGSEPLFVGEDFDSSAYFQGDGPND
ncbi:MAG TPA: DUF927 domain-containing protein [Methanosarcina sp.]|jgi:uncharacterized protein (DUF927 family)